MYTTPQNIRDLIGLELEDATDDVLEEFIERAQAQVLHYIQIQVLDEKVSLDSSGTTFSLDKRFMADTNFDKAVTTSDFIIYGWKETSSGALDPGQREVLEVSTFYPEYGRIVLKSDASDYAQVTANYSYYTCSMDWDLLETATAYYAGMLWVAREGFLVPEDLVIGNVRIRDRKNRPWERIKIEFDRIIFHITTVPMDLTNYQKMVMSPRGGRYLGPGTTYQAEDKAAYEE